MRERRAFLIRSVIAIVALFGAAMVGIYGADKMVERAALRAAERTVLGTVKTIETGVRVIAEFPVANRSAKTDRAPVAMRARLMTSAVTYRVTTLGDDLCPCVDL